MENSLLGSPRKIEKLPVIVASHPVTTSAPAPVIVNNAKSNSFYLPPINHKSTPTSVALRESVSAPELSTVETVIANSEPAASVGDFTSISTLFGSSNHAKYTLEIQNFLIKEPALKKVLIIAEDLIVNVKVLRQTIVNKIDPNAIKNSPLQKIKKEMWVAQKIATEVIGDYGIVYVENGAVANEVIESFPEEMAITLLTDQEMPIMTGTDLIGQIAKTKRRDSIPIAIHTSLDRAHPDIAKCMSDIDNILYIEKSDVSKIEEFIENNFLNTPAVSELINVTSTVSINPMMD